MKRFKCVIIDDDNYAISRLSEYIAATENLVLYAAYNDSEVAQKEIRKGPQIDFLFMDITLPKISGIELAKQVGDKSRFCIFMSSQLERALEAFDVEATHFILKPFTIKRFQDTIGTVLARAHKLTADRPFIMIKCTPNTQIIKLFHDTIIVIEGASNYIKISTTEKNYITYRKMSDIELELGDKFLRVNKSYIVAENYIEKIDGDHVHMYNEQVIKIGSTYKKKMAAYINSRIKGGQQTEG